MAMTGQETATDPDVEKTPRGNLVEDLTAAVADADELVKLAAGRTAERNGECGSRTT